MTEYQCPSCRGGFPEIVDGGCPWCGQQLGESVCGPTVRNVVKRERDGEEGPKGALGKLFS